MKKKQWIMGLLIIGIIGVIVAVYAGSLDERDKPVPNFVETNSGKEEEHSTDSSGEDENASAKQTFEEENSESNSSKKESSKILDAEMLPDTETDNQKSDSDSMVKPDDGAGTELPFIPFE